ncbi:DUF1178 family protein [Novosphingobium sp. TCA1]|uniref:DUF1178 family protein n=1 Tax=Novosphingobium sp. TCA1 TaxID=2682474 RepID=UPI00130BCD98|nr:DUF1178 family protein [Novosphingobium sp. TCA1]GFE74232.1 hypothetical protein NTCA1_18810 [Novosphingobium sp. TCA1]
MPIVFDLECRSAQHRFEGWFKSSDDYARQQERGLLACPQCGSAEVFKAVQAPRLGRKGNQRSESAAGPLPAKIPSSPPSADLPAPPPVELPPQAVEVLQKLAVMQAEALKSSRFVGDSFVEDARAMHYGERDSESIHGRATPEQAKELIEEGIAVAPLPFPIVPPEKAN